MDYKKLYEEALARAKKLKENPKAIFFEEENIHVSDYIFPELKESENERIRKAQLDYWRSVGGKEWHGVPVQETIAWLEKQKSIEWRQEDDMIFNELYDFLINKKPVLQRDCNIYAHWLKSLKQRIGE